MIQLKVLILGANGYIGNSLLHYLNRVHELIAYDKVFTTEELANVKYITGDYLNIDSYSQAIKESDVIFNFIGLSGAANSVRKTLLYNSINIDAHLKFIDYVYSLGLEKKIIFISSRLVYGKTGNRIVDELTPCCPLDFYGIQKRTIEEYLRVYSSLNSKISTTVIRLSNPYGYYNRPESTPGYNFINALIDKIYHKEEIVLYGTGQQKRDYIYIDDVLFAFETLLSSKDNYSIYNLGAGNSISIIDAINTISNIIGKKALVKNVEWPSLDYILETGDCFMSIEKLKQLGWKPFFSFEDGIKRTFDVKCIEN